MEIENKNVQTFNYIQIKDLEYDRVGYAPHYNPQNIAVRTIEAIKPSCHNDPDFYLWYNKIHVFPLVKVDAGECTRGCHDTIYSVIVMIEGYLPLDDVDFSTHFPEFKVTPIIGGFQLSRIW